MSDIIQNNNKIQILLDFVDSVVTNIAQPPQEIHELHRYTSDYSLSEGTKHDHHENSGVKSFKSIKKAGTWFHRAHIKADPFLLLNTHLFLNLIYKEWQKQSTTKKRVSIKMECSCFMVI